MYTDLGAHKQLSSVEGLVVVRVGCEAAMVTEEVRFGVLERPADSVPLGGGGSVPEPFEELHAWQVPVVGFVEHSPTRFVRVTVERVPPVLQEGGKVDPRGERRTEERSKRRGLGRTGGIPVEKETGKQREHPPDCDRLPCQVFVGSGLRGVRRSISWRDRERGTLRDVPNSSPRLSGSRT